MGSPAIKCHECGTWIFESSGEFYDREDENLTIHDEARCAKIGDPRSMPALLGNAFEAIGRLAAHVTDLTIRVGDLTRRLNALDGKEE